MSGLSITAPRTDLKDLHRENEEMSDKDRQEALADIYGTGTPLPETPQLLAETLAALQVELDGIPLDQYSQAYQTARERLPEYVNSSDFLSSFLRADLFDPEAAAKKIVKYWAMRLRLFGEDIAYGGHLIRLTDLTDDDMATLYNEGLTLLPDTDLAGRGILVSTRQKWVYEQKENVARIFFYLLQSAVSDDTEIQRQGLVVVLFDDGDISLLKHFDRKLERLVQDMIQSMPIRLTGVHHLFDSKIASIIHPFLLFMFGRKFRSRYRMYGVNDKETRKQRLLECGLSMDILPTRMGGGSAVAPDIFVASQQQAEDAEVD